MPSGFKISGGADLDTLFAPRAGSEARLPTGYKVDNADLADRYMASTSEADRIATNTNYRSGETDLKNLFRNIAYVAPPATPVFTLHPAGGMRREGTTVVFTITATGAVSYQWQKNGADLSGETGTSLTLTSVGNADEGTYRCVATNAAGSTNSNGAALDVAIDPVITVGPGGPYPRLIGEVASLSITATGDGVGYQWSKDGSPISGATASTYVFMVTASGDAGSYACVASNAFASATSAAAVISVSITNPTVTSPPSSFTAANGTRPYSVQCSATVRAEEGPVYFHWYNSGSSVTTNRPGNISPTQDQHVFDPIGYADAGGWVCVCSTTYGGLTNSAYAVVTVT